MISLVSLLVLFSSERGNLSIFDEQISVIFVAVFHFDSQNYSIARKIETETQDWSTVTLKTAAGLSVCSM